MARSRTLKPSFFTNDQLAELPFWVRLLFQGLWTAADRDGLLEDKPKKLKATLFPYDDVDVNDGLGQLAKAGFIARYDANGTPAICVTNFAKHQNPHPKEPSSGISNLIKLQAVKKNGKKAAGNLISGTSRAVSNPSVSNPSTTAKDGVLEFSDPIEEHVDLVSERIYSRHPSIRRCGPAEIKKHLRTITAKIKTAEAKIAKLYAIDAIHAAWCGTEDWTKEDGKFAKGLDNWLAPTMGRFDVAPARDPPKEKPTIYTKLKDPFKEENEPLQTH
jgi:hypothetical protein